MADVFTLFGRIAINSDEAYSAIDGVAGRAGGLAASLKKAGSVIAKGAAAGAVAVGALAKASIGSYAEYEQLVGGVDTLFKESSKKVQAYASNAYKTAGVSANKYMDTVTAFSSSLLQSLSGDTEKAADYAHMAVTDMADNANKMGTDMASIQNAYQGFAKQNYTMLDNLKLGYGGTKTEMQRLLKDAQKLTGQKYNIKNLNDVFEAIHAIQEEMGITGTTALEAEETISGSWNTLKASWENLMIGLSDGNADIDQLFENLSTSALNVAKNIGKVIPSLVKNVGRAVGDVMQYAGEKIQSGWENTVYPFIQDKFKLAFGVELPDWGTIESELSTKWEEIKGLFTDLNLSEKLQPALENVQSFAGDVGTALGEIGKWATGDGAQLLEVVGKIALGFAGISLAIGLLSNPLATLGIAIAAIATNWEDVKNAADLAFHTTVDWLSNNIGPAAEKFRKSVIEPIASGWETAKAAISGAVDSVSDFLGIDLKEGWNTLTDSIKSAWQGVKDVIDSITSSIENLLGLGGGEMLGGGDAPYPYMNSDKYKSLGGNGETPNVGEAEITLSPSADSEGNIQGAVSGYNLNGKAKINADPSSGGLLQGFLNSLNLTAPVTLTPKMGKINLGGFINGSHAGGLDRVPYDGYIAELHKDETVLKASDAAVYRGERPARTGGAANQRNRRSWSDDQPIQLTVNINGDTKDPYENAQQMRNALELMRWMG